MLPWEQRRRLCLAFATVARDHPAGSAVVIAVGILGVRLCCLPILPRPTPIIPDEFSYVLLGRTLAAGRFANSAHPMWRHFETLFVLQHPSYASVYPPAQGAVLAFGEVLFGEPWAGVLASIGCMLIAMVWMLRSYVTRDWALYGGVLAGAGYGVMSYWSNSFWGGAVAATGGAMVVGALPRMMDRRRRRDAAILGLGLIVLANSRPYEGFLTALPVVLCLVWSLRAAPQRRLTLRKHAPVLACVLLSGTAFTCFYNWRVTGSPYLLPHTAYIAQYAAAPAFVWQRPPRAPEYSDRVLHDAHTSFGIDYVEYSTLAGAAAKSTMKIARLAAFYWGPLWILAALAIPDFVREPRFRVAACALALCITGILLTVAFQEHYAAPCASIFLLILVDASRRLCKRWRTVGAIVVIASPIAWTGSEAATARLAPQADWPALRRSVEAKIAAAPGRHVVLVHYDPWHALGQEWVYNGPDIDSSRIIWARDLGRERNGELIGYFSDRTFWLVEPDHPVPIVTRCTSECAAHADNLQDQRVPDR